VPCADGVAMTTRLSTAGDIRKFGYCGVTFLSAAE